MKSGVSRQHGKCAATQPVIQFIDAGGHLHAAAFEGGSELIVERDDRCASRHDTSAIERKWWEADPLPRIRQHVATRRRRPFGRREARECFEEEDFGPAAASEAAE